MNDRENFLGRGRVYGPLAQLVFGDIRLLRWFSRSWVYFLSSDIQRVLGRSSERSAAKGWDKGARSARNIMQRDPYDDAIPILQQSHRHEACKNSQSKL